MRATILVAVIVLGACGASAPPAPLPLLSSPGQVIAGHATLDCLGCHVAASAQLDETKCIACHAPLRARGLHTSKLVRDRPCETCHLDHRGAAYDSVGWTSLPGGRTAFDHRLTGWRLEGAHRTAPCEQCHTTGVNDRPSYTGVDRACSTCHTNQPHGFQRRELFACERCHTTARWAPPKRVLDFDHDAPRDARMALRGGHRDVACAACHPKALFSSSLVDPRRCENCHQSPHVDRPFGKVACAMCHDESAFRPARFDHDEHTRFGLGPSHRKLACATCHTPALGAALPSAACETCHAARTPHKDRFKAFGTPAKCALCHTPSGRFDPATPTVLAPWRPNNFNHGKQTGWALSFMHGQVTCRQCHRGTTPDQFERLNKGAACKGCHAHETVHADDTHPKGRFTDQQCLQCHVSPGYSSP